MPAAIRGAEGAHLATTLRDRDAWMRALLASDEHETVKLIGLRLALYLNIQSGRCDPSYDGIARDIGGVSKDTATRAAKTLEAHGWVSIDRAVGRGRTNSFTLLSQEKAAPRCGLSGDGKGRIQTQPFPSEKAASGHLKGRKTPPEKAAPRCGPNREENREEGTERESALARDTLTCPPDVRRATSGALEGEILPPARRGKGTPLPPDWRPSAEGWQYAADKGLTTEAIEDEIQRLRDWAAETNRHSANWDAAWRRWAGGSRLGERNRRKSPIDIARDHLDEAVAEEHAMHAAGVDPRDPAAARRFRALRSQSP